MVNISFKTPDGIHWTAIDKGLFYRFTKNGGHTVEDILYQKEFDGVYPGFIDLALQIRRDF